MKTVLAACACMALIGGAYALPAQAMSYVPITDAALLAEVDAVIVGTVTNAGPAPGQELQTTEYAVQPLQVLKGVLALVPALVPTPAPVTVEVPGAFDSMLDGAATVPGAPQFAVGDQVTLFLHRLDDGHYAIAELALGAFKVTLSVSGTPLLVRDLSEANNACGDCAAEPEQSHRELGKFSAWVRAQAAGLPAHGGYWNTEAVAAPIVQPRFFTASPQSRWFEFDAGQSVPFHVGAPGERGLPDGGYTEFLEAILAWNLNLGTRINYSFAGATTAHGGLSNQDGINEILFNDPNNELNGPFNCSTGGLLAYTVFWTSGSGTFNNQTFQRIVESHIVVRKGDACFLIGHLFLNATELFGHELGHTLGLAHPCGDPGKAACVPGSRQDAALMRPYLHADGRGAALAADDKAGAAYLYGRTGLTSGIPPIPPLTAGAPPSGGGIPPSGDVPTGGSHGGGWDAVALGVLWCLFCLRRWRPRMAIQSRRGG